LSPISAMATKAVEKRNASNGELRGRRANRGP
jgi:hypothetical protein